MVAVRGLERTEFSGNSTDGPVGQLYGHQEEILVLLSQPVLTIHSSQPPGNHVKGRARETPEVS